MQIKIKQQRCAPKACLSANVKPLGGGQSVSPACRGLSTHRAASTMHAWGPCANILQVSEGRIRGGVHLQGLQQGWGSAWHRPRGCCCKCLCQDAERCSRCLSLQQGKQGFLSASFSHPLVAISDFRLPAASHAHNAHAKLCRQCCNQSEQAPWNSRYARCSCSASPAAPGSVCGRQARAAAR